MPVGDGADHGSLVLGSSVQLEHEAQGFVDRPEFVVAEPSNEFAESLVRYRLCLFDQDLGVVSVDGDRGAENPRCR